MRKSIFFLTAMLMSVIGAWADGIYFTYDPSKYSDETVIYLALTDAMGMRMDYPNSCVGAFIGGECRDEAFAEYDQMSGHYYYMVRVRGDADRERGQAITFRVMLEYGGGATTGTGTRLEYWIDSDTPLATFQGDDRTTEISNPLLITFIPITEISFKQEPIHVHRGQTLDLLSLIDREVPPGVDGCLPQLQWYYDDYAANFFKIEGNNITGLKLTDEFGVTLSVGYNQQIMREVQVVVDLLASSVQWQEEYRLGATVSVGDYEKLNDILDNGYILTPADAVTTFLWTSSNTEVVGFDQMHHWTPLKAGFAVLTGTAQDGSGLTLTLNVTVIQPVTQVFFDGETSGNMMAIVGEDITDRLNSKISVYPSDATNKEVRWTIDPDNTSVVWKNGRLIADKSTNGDYIGSQKLYAVAADGFGAQAEVEVSILPVQPTGLKVVQNPLYMSFDANGTPVDVTTQITNNVKVLPEGVEDPYVWFDIANEDGSNVLQLNQNDYGPVIFLVGTGTCTVTAHVMAIDAYNNDERELEASFQVIVRQGLSGFFVDNVEVASGQTVTVKLKEQPEGTSFDPSLVSLRVVTDGGQSDKPFPAGWTFATVTKSAPDGLTYTLNAQCLGTAGLVASYNGQDMGWGTVNVLQRLTMNDGWQWIALTQDQMDAASMHYAFGDNLSEIRSVDQLLINDSQQGYVGRLTTLIPCTTYKLRMKGLGSAQKTYDIPGGNYLYLYATTGTDLSCRKGWNWVGNIYQYYQPLNSIFSNYPFTKGDIIKCKNAFATYDGSQWQGTLRYLAPGEGMLIYLQKAGTVKFTPEFNLSQNLTLPQTSRSQSSISDLQSPTFSVDGSKFDDNMAMIAYVGNVDDPTQVTLYAFVGDECRGCGEAIGDRQFITVHGQAGETVTFKVFDPLTGNLHDIFGSRQWQPLMGSISAPVSLYAGQVSGIEEMEDGRCKMEDSVYDLQGRRIGSAQLKKGVYIQHGKKHIR